MQTVSVVVVGKRETWNGPIVNARPLLAFSDSSKAEAIAESYKEKCEYGYDAMCVEVPLDHPTPKIVRLYGVETNIATGEQATVFDEEVQDDGESYEHYHQITHSRKGYTPVVYTKAKASLYEAQERGRRVRELIMSAMATEATA